MMARSISRAKCSWYASYDAPVCDREIRFRKTYHFLTLSSMSSLESNIWKLHGITLFQGILFAVPIMVLFWQSHGLTMYEVMLLQSLFALAIVIFEVPTGYFADRMTRKMSLILGWFLLALGYGIYGLSETFSSFLIAELTLALGLSFLSGAQSAFLYETLLALSREDEHTKILGHNEFLRYISLATSQIVWGFMAVYFSYNLLLLTSVPFLFVGFILTLTLSEPKISARETERHVSSVESFLSVIREHFHPSGKLLRIIVISSLILGLTQAVLWLYQPYFTFTDVPVYYFGIIFASFQIVAAFASKYAHSIEKNSDRRHMLPHHSSSHSVISLWHFSSFHLDLYLHMHNRLYEDFSFQS